MIIVANKSMGETCASLGKMKKNDKRRKEKCPRCAETEYHDSPFSMKGNTAASVILGNTNFLQLVTSSLLNLM